MKQAAIFLTEIPAGVISAIISAAVALTVSLATVREARRWRRKEYFLETFDRMNSSPGSRNALLFLFHEEAIVPLYATGDDRWQKVSQQEAALALIGDAGRVTHLDDRQSALRNSMIDFITQLEAVRSVAKMTRVGPSSSRQIVGAIGETLCGSAYSRRGGPSKNYIAAAVKWHLEYLDMIDLVLFFRRLGYDIRLTDADQSLLEDIMPGVLDPRSSKIHGTELTKLAYMSWALDTLTLRALRFWRRARLWSND